MYILHSKPCCHVRSLKYAIYRHGFLLILISLLLAGCQSPFDREQEAGTLISFTEAGEALSGDQAFLVLVHPTVQNMQTLRFLIDEGIFPLPDDYHILGLYHKAAAYDYSQSEKFIAREGLDGFILLGLEPELDIAQLFQTNVLTEAFRHIFDHSAGMIFFGGPDIPPFTYGEPTHLLTVITDPQRHYMELSLLFHLLGGYQNSRHIPFLESRPEYPLLGLCLGMQSMNVASGGTMIQDIPLQVYGLHYVEEVLALDPDKQHRNYWVPLRLDAELRAASYHRIRIAPESRLAGIAGQGITPYVLSSHHQAVDRLGLGFSAVAWSVDGLIIEALEHQTYPNVLGVQFHPEVPHLFQPGEALRVIPFDSLALSFPLAYPGSKGMDFHYRFWAARATLFAQDVTM